MISKKWVLTASDEEFYKEREKIRLKHCRGDENATRLLEVFNNAEFTRLNAKFDREHPDWDKQEHKRWTDANRWEKD